MTQESKLKLTSIHKPNPEVIKILEKLLEEAKSGELQSIAVVSLYYDSNYSSSIGVCKGQRKLELIGAVVELQSVVQSIKL